MTVNFALLAMDQIVNHMAKIRYMFGGQTSLPMVVRMPGGGGSQLAAQHSQIAGELFHALPRHASRLPGHAGRRQGAAEERHPRQQPGDLPRTRTALQQQGGGAGRSGIPGAVRPGQGHARGQRRDHRRLRPHDGPGPAGRRRPGEGGDLLRGDRPAHPQPTGHAKRFMASARKTGRAVVVEECWRSSGLGGDLAHRIHESVLRLPCWPRSSAWPGWMCRCPIPAKIEKLCIPTR